jgi:Flp pilus assembly CpaE family ATPase
LTKKAIEATLARPIYAKIPADDRTFESIEMKAQDLFQLAPSSPVARAMLDLAALVMPRTEPAALQDTFMSRLKSAFVTH